MRKLVFILFLILLVGGDGSIACEQDVHIGQITTISTRQELFASSDQGRTSGFLGLETARSQNYVWIKYRPTPVNIADPRFEYLDTSRSSFVTGAWYDKKNSYMIIGLGGTYYHYCRMPREAWNSFCSADSFGKHFNGFIKGRYDCRLGGVPDYQ